MNKDEIKKEFAEFCHSSALEGNLKYPTYNQIADFWLSKLDRATEEGFALAEITMKANYEQWKMAYQSSLLEKIEKINTDGGGSGRRIKDQIITLIKEK